MTLLHEIEDLIVRHAPGDLGLSAVPGVGLTCSEVPTPQTHVVYKPMLCAVVGGAKQALLGEQTFTYRAGDCLVVSAELPVSGWVTDAPYRAVGVELDPAAIARLMIETGERPGSDQPPMRGLVVTRMDDALLDPIARLLRLLDRPADIAVMQPMIEREILWRLLHGDYAETVRQIGSTDSRLSGVNRAIRWIRANFAEPMRIERLADLAGMSLSTFHRHFRTVTTMSPLQFQKQVRLQEARARLLSGGDSAAGAGFAVGYDSPSQFSREYARLFGAPPARDVARMRTAGLTI